MASANERPQDQCIKLWSEPRVVDSMTPNAITVHAITREVLTGTAAYGLAYIEHADGRGAISVDRNLKQMFLFPTQNGLYLLRILDLPPGLGLHGPF